MFTQIAIEFLQRVDVTYWAFQTAAMMLTCFLLPNLEVRGPIPAFFTVLVLAFINAHVWNAALFFNIPNTFTMQTLSLLLVNGIIFWIVVKILPGIDIEGVLPAIIAPIVFTVCSVAISHFGSQVNWNEVGKTVSDEIRNAKSYFEQLQSQQTTQSPMELLPLPNIQPTLQSQKYEKRKF